MTPSRKSSKRKSKSGKRKPKFSKWSAPLGFPSEAADWVRTILKDPKQTILIILPAKDPEILREKILGPTTILLCNLSLKPAIKSSCEVLPYGPDGFDDLFNDLKTKGIDQKGFWEMLRSARIWYCWALFFLVIGEAKKQVRRNRNRFFLSMTNPGRTLAYIDAKDQSLYDEWIKEIGAIRCALAEPAERLPSALGGLDRWKKLPIGGQELLRAMLGKETVKGMLRRSAGGDPLLHMLPFWNQVILQLTKELREKGLKGDKVFQIIGWAFHLVFPSFWPVSALTWKSKIQAQDLSTPDEIKAALAVHIKRRYYDHA